MRSTPATGPQDRQPLDPWTTAAALVTIVVTVAVTVLSSSLGAGGVRAYPADANRPDTSVAARGRPVGGIAKGTVYAPFAVAGFSVDVPARWQRTDRTAYVSFADRLDLVTVEWAKAAAAPSTATARTVEVPALRAHARTFTLESVLPVRRPAGSGVEIAYLQGGSPDVDTGRVVVHAVERYSFFRGGLRVTLTLAGPRGADNTAAWRRITGSLRWVH